MSQRRSLSPFTCRDDLHATLPHSAANDIAAPARGERGRVRAYFVLYQTLPDALQNRTSSDVRPTTILGIPHAEVYIGLRPAPAPGLLSTSDVLERLRPAIAAAK